MPDFRLPPLNAGERLYRALLHAYPARFRRAFAQDLVETFRDERREARRAGLPAAAFWTATVHDVVTHGLAERGASGWRALRGAGPNEESLMVALSQAFHRSELRIALRRLRRAPTFVAATIAVLALGVGATASVFSVVNGVVLRPLPYPHAERLVALTHSVQVAGTTTVDQSDAGLLFYQEHATAFVASGGWGNRDVNVSPPADDPGPPERVSAAAVTANLFSILGVRPALGRDFHAGEDRANAAPTVLISDRLWRRYFRADPSAVGKRMIIDGVSRQIIGVMPRSFQFPVTSPELWYPLPLDPATAVVGSFNYQAIARLAPGQTPSSARADLARILPRLIEEFPSGIPRAMWDQAHVTPIVTPLRDHIVGDVSRLLWILLGSVALVLLIACANVASLFLVRAESRQLEIAVRGALGSGTAGMMAQPMSEAVVLAGVGGALGIGIAGAAVNALHLFGARLALPRVAEVSVDWRVVAFALGVSALAAVLVSVIPMLRARRLPIAIVIRESGRTGTSGARQRARSVLVVVQVALALVLVSASGLLARSFAHLRDVRPGFDADSVIMARIVLPRATYATQTSVVQLHNRLLASIRALPGVRSASITDFVPLSGDENNGGMQIEDHPQPADAVPPVHSIATIDRDYFRTMRIPILRGRTIGPVDPAHPLAEVVVSRAFAEQVWPGESPLGKRVRFGFSGEWLTVVGEVGDVHYLALDKPATDIIYVPLISPDTQWLEPPRYASLLVDAGSRGSTVAPEIRAAVRAIDPSLPTYDEQPLSNVVSNATARARLTLALLALASGLALVLGAVGIYGVMAYAVSLRQREIGVRLALGAQPGEVSRMISRQGLLLGAAGVAIGMACALAVTRLLRGFLYDISPTDPLTLGVTCVALLGIAAVASWAPARRAASIDPSEALRRG